MILGGGGERTIGRARRRGVDCGELSVKCFEIKKTAGDTLVVAK